MVQRGPVVVAISANNKYIHSYASGIIDAEDCSDVKLVDWERLNTVNHGVLLVGHGKDKATGLNYFLIRNSWGTTWGD